MQEHEGGGHNTETREDGEDNDAQADTAHEGLAEQARRVGEGEGDGGEEQCVCCEWYETNLDCAHQWGVVVEDGGRGLAQPHQEEALEVGYEGDNKEEEEGE